jgi:NAD(P)-dependent dehydrogenase (short-subunit alcohol dehydrogenase family)
MGRLDGKVALISGGAKSQGAAEARAFVSEGAKVVFGDILDDLGNELAKDINVHSKNAKYVHLDVTLEDDWKKAIQTTVSEYGKLDVLVNNAGIVINRVPIEQRTVEEWDRVQAVNSRGVFLGTKHAIPAMRDSGGGSIINICSVAGYGQSTTQEPAYAASKGAVRIFSKVTATQHAKDNIRSNAIFPGPIDTEMVHAAMSDPKVLAERLTRVPMGRLGLVKEIVAGVIFLASDESSYMTGGELVIDGGATSM